MRRETGGALVVATVTRRADLDWLEREGVPPEIDVLEFRLDGLRADLDEAESVLDGLSQEILITARCPSEGGEGDLDEATRERLLRRFLARASWVDVELATLKRGGRWIQFLDAARGEGVATVGSFHDFKATPPRAELERRAALGRELGVDVVKVAVSLDGFPELRDVLEWMEREAGSIPLSVMGMGSLGRLSRLVFARAGSRLNYGYLREANAPGQWAAVDLKRLLGQL